VVPVLAGCLAMVAVLLVGLIVANATSWAGSPRFYDPIVVVPNLLIGSLVAVAVAAAGVGISLRAKRVQDAQQMISLMLMVPAMALGLLLFVLAEMTGGVGEAAAQLDGMNGWIIALAVIGALVVLDAAMLITARRRFRRNRLITLA